MEHKPLVSVVVPAYNAESTILMTVQSVLRQTYGSLELLVVDDGSSDGTVAALSSVRDQRLQVIRQENGGVGSARNLGMALASGDFIAFVDSDDFWLPNYLSIAMSLLKDHRRRFVTCNGMYVFEGGVSSVFPRPSEFPGADGQRSKLLRRNWISIMSVFPRAMMDEVGGFDVELSRAEDWDYWLRAVFLGWEVVLQPIPLAVFDRTTVTRSSAVHELARAEDVVINKMASRLDLLEREFAYLEHRREVPGVGLLVYQLDDALVGGDYSRALSLLKDMGKADLLDGRQRILAFCLSVAPWVFGPYLKRRRTQLRQGGRGLVRDPDDGLEP